MLKVLRNMLSANPARVRTNPAGVTPKGKRAQESISRDVWPDYTCYRLISGRKSVAIVIEAKMASSINAGCNPFCQMIRLAD